MSMFNTGPSTKGRSTKDRTVVHRSLLMGFFAALLSLVGCDGQNIAKLEEGVSTEADVRKAFGEPEKVWDGAGGARIFEYNRNPAGHRNYMITLGTDGKMASLRQVLTPENFAQVKDGMMLEEVRRMLGKPAKTNAYALKPTETVYHWRFLQAPSSSMMFSVYFNANLLVIKTETGPDPEGVEYRGGP